MIIKKPKHSNTVYCNGTPVGFAMVSRQGRWRTAATQAWLWVIAPITICRLLWSIWRDGIDMDERMP